jgi:hypothetical protein
VPPSRSPGDGAGPAVRPSGAGGVAAGEGGGGLFELEVEEALSRQLEADLDDAFDSCFSR